MSEHAFLSSAYPLPALERLLLPRASWQPYPAASWKGLPPETRRQLVALGEAALQAPWPPLPATLYKRFARDGDRQAFERPYFLRRDQLAAMVLAECAEGRGRFLDAITDAAWSICEESSWCLPAHIGAQKAGTDLPDVTEPIVDLFAAETGMTLAWTHYLLAGQLPKVSPLILPRLEHEIQTRILTPALERDDFWWMGFSGRLVNNWNPWINSNWLAAVLLIEKDEARRLRAVHKILRSLDQFLVPYPEDGGCDEGPSYWTRAGASLYDCLELLHAVSNGAIDIYSDPKIQNIGRYVYRAFIAGDYYVNFADAPAIVFPDAALVSGYGERIGDRAMQSMGTWLAARSSRSPDRDLTRSLARLFRRPSFPSKGDEQKAAVTAPFLRDVYLPDIQFFAARDRAGSSDGFYLAAKGGHNDESHNHNDVGHFIVYLDGKPLIVDAGVGTYTRKTFSEQRYEIWTMQSAYHSLPTMDGVMQAPGRQYAARKVEYHMDDETAQFKLDIAAAYPPEAKLTTWLRQVTLWRGKEVTLEDGYRFHSAPRVLTLSLLTPCRADISAAGQCVLGAMELPGGRRSASGRILYDPGQLSLTGEEINVKDAALCSAWGERLVRLLFQVLEPADTGSWKLSITSG